MCVCVMTKEVTGGSGGCIRVLFGSQDVCSVARTALNMFLLCTWHVAIRVMSALFAVTHGRPGVRTLVCLPSLAEPKTHTHTHRGLKLDIHSLLYPLASRCLMFPVFVWTWTEMDIVHKDYSCAQLPVSPAQ